MRENNLKNPFRQIIKGHGWACMPVGELYHLHVCVYLYISVRMYENSLHILHLVLQGHQDYWQPLQDRADWFQADIPP